jgi:hypothetical protein
MKKPSLLLLGCVSMLLGSDGGGLTSADLPACGPNTYLAYSGGQLVCAPSLPSCPGQLLALGPTVDLSALHCVDKYDDAFTAAERQRVTALQAEVQSLQNELTQLTGVLGGTTGFVGSTRTTTVGRIQYPGTPAGLPSANALCAAELGAGAHMCTLGDLVGGVLNATFDPNSDVSKAWFYMPTWNTPLHGAQEPLSGLADSCGGYTDGTADNNWAGMAVEWILGYRDIRVLYFDSGSLAPCDQPLPVACCR